MRTLDAGDRSHAGDEILDTRIDCADLDAMASADLIADFSRARKHGVSPVGTCRMGKAAGESVVDASLKVHGIERLRASTHPCFRRSRRRIPMHRPSWWRKKAADLILKG